MLFVLRVNVCVLIICRHLGSQLAELENAIEKMMECDFVRFFMEGLKMKLNSQEKISGEDKQTTEVRKKVFSVCIVPCSMYMQTYVVCIVCVQGHPQGVGGRQLGHFSLGPSLKGAPRRPHEGPPEYLFKRPIYSNRAVTVFFRGAV